VRLVFYQQVLIDASCLLITGAPKKQEDAEKILSTKRQALLIAAAAAGAIYHQAYRKTGLPSNALMLFTNHINF
jgi:hypothetical protein